MQINNIDYTDASLNTKAPFNYACPLRLWGSSLPTGAFVSIKIYIPETAKPPVRLYCITEDEAAFHDSLGAYIGSWHFNDPCTSYGTGVLQLIKNRSDIVVGHLVADPYTAAILKQTAVLSGGPFYTDVADFSLLPQCHIQRLDGTCRAIVLDGVPHTGSVTLTGGVTPVSGGTVSTHLTDRNGAVAVSLEGYYAPPSTNGLCVLQVGNDRFWIGDQHLYVIAGVQSNLRVVTSNGVVTFKGVMDV